MHLFPRRRAAPATTTTTRSRHGGGLFSSRRQRRNHHHHHHGVTTTRPVHHHKRHATLGDKISGALLKLKGSLTGRPGQKAAGSRRMHGTDGRGARRRRFF